MKDDLQSAMIAIDGNALNLERVEEDGVKFLKGEYANITLDMLFSLSIAASEHTALEELILVVKYGFATT